MNWIHNTYIDRHKLSEIIFQCFSPLIKDIVLKDIESEAFFSL